MRRLQRPARPAAIALLALLVAACGDTPSADADALPSTGELVATMAKAATLGQYYLRRARDVATPELLAALAAADADADPTPLEPGALAQAEAALGVPLPADLREVLALPAAWRGFGWSDPGDYAWAKHRFGDALGERLNLAGADWRTREIVVENFHGDAFRLPAGALEHYVVIGENEFFDDLVLYDPSEPPRHACCRLLETPVLASDTVSAYASVRDYLEVAWAMHQVE
jgi:hypothetical protein